MSEWASGDVSQVVKWDAGTSGNVSYLQFSRDNQREFAESGEIASWGTWYLATSSEPGVSYNESA